MASCLVLRTRSNQLGEFVFASVPVGKLRADLEQPAGLRSAARPGLLPRAGSEVVTDVVLSIDPDAPRPGHRPRLQERWQHAGAGFDVYLGHFVQNRYFRPTPGRRPTSIGIFAFDQVQGGWL